MRLSEIKTPAQKRAVLELQQSLADLGYEVTSVIEYDVGINNARVSMRVSGDEKNYELTLDEKGGLTVTLPPDGLSMTGYVSVESFLTSVKRNGKIS